MQELYSITELTREFGLTTRTLRFYEDEGLIAPVRRGRQRLYRAGDRTRLKLILRGRRLGFSVAEIRDIIGMYSSAPGEAGQLHHLIDRIAARRADLLQKQRDIEVSLAELDEVEQGCRARLSRLAAEETGKADANA